MGQVEGSGSALARRMLLIVRAGDRSLHPMWLKGASEQDRSWDLHISYYGDSSEPFGDRPADVTLSREKGPKFLGLLSAISSLGDRIDQYDYIGFPDDDLACNGQTWNRFLEVILERQPQLCQPALSRRSFFSFPELLQQRGASVRWCNFVELMTPVFSRAALRRALPHFGENSSGWGMDLLWPTLFKAEQLTMCIVDETPVLHTRAVGISPLYSETLAGAPSPFAEMESFIERHGLTRIPFKVFAAINLAGRWMEGEHTQPSPALLPRLRQKLRRGLGVRQLHVTT